MLRRILPLLTCLFIVSELKAQPADARASYKTGLAYKQAANYAEALNAFKKAVSLNKNFDSAHVELGNLYSGSGNIELAVSHYKKALAINPNFTNALVGMAKLYRDAMKTADTASNNRQLDTAIYYFDAAEKIDKRNKEIYYGLAWIYNAKQQYEKAIPNAVRSLEIDNTYKPAYGELGHAYRATKNYAGCIEQMKKNLAVSVVDVALLYSGYCYTELKDREGAMQQYEALLKVNEKMAMGLKRKIDASFPGN